MTHRVHLTTLLVVAALAPAAALGAQTATRPMTFDDIMAIRNVGAVDLSPDGATIAYTVSAWEHPNAPKHAGPSSAADTAKGDRHERRSHVWLVPAAGGAAR